MKQNEKVDFNEPTNLGAIVDSIMSEKTGKSVKVPYKSMIALAIYFLLSGLCLNVYWVYLLILKLF